jgi:N-acetylglutamate synthase-like GNAT family acetyltransferase
MSKSLELKVREPEPNEFDEIYLMGFDTWGDGAKLADYLECCRNSPKYRHGQWFVLERNGDLVSSLLVHSFGDDVFGIGSIATNPAQRNSGFASVLIERVLEYLQKHRGSRVTYLYSDINPKFYEGFGFVCLPSGLQKYSTTTCMVRFAKEFQADLHKLKPPTYF